MPHHRSAPGRLPGRPTLATLAGLVVTALVAGLGVLAPAQAASAAVADAPAADTRTAGWAARALTPPSGLLFGASVAKGTHASTEAAVTAFERGAGRKLDLHRWYSQWDDPMPPASVTSSIARGRTPVLSVAAKRVDGTTVSWASIASGAQDGQIVRQARAIAALDVPLFLSFQHEPDYATGFGTPAEYRAAWRHYVEVFRAQGVTNVVWTWIVTPTPFASASSAAADALYPGDDVVDWVALDAYNWFGCSTNGQTAWSSMARTAAAFRAFGQAHGKPLMIAEWGSVEDPADPDRKATWIRDTMATFTAWPEVKAVLYFHHHGSCPWFVDSTPQSLGAFAAAGALPAARTRASAYLGASALHGAAPLTVTFDGSRSSDARTGAGQGVASWTLDPGDGSAPVRGTGRPPATLGHTFRAGTWTARLSVVGTSGATATDSLTITSAPAPTVTLEAKDVTATTAHLHAFADLHGYAGTVRFEWGTTTAYGNWGPVQSVPLVPYVKTMRHVASGLRAGTTYHWRATTRSPAGTTVVTGSFGTAGRPTSSRQFTSGSTRTSTTFAAQVHPHRLPTTARLEWGTTSSLGRVSPVTSLPGLTYEKTVTSGLVTGLTPGATYYYRVVATNALGTVTGPVLSMRTPR